MSDSAIQSTTPRPILYWQLARPFTLLAPALGMLSGGITALGARPPDTLTWSLGFNLLLGTAMAAALNAASNALNQIYDLEVDRVNKPRRPLPSGRLSIGEAWVATGILGAFALCLAWAVNLQCFLLAAAAAVFTTAYSAPPLRTKARGVWANITIAIPRGVLLKVAGWSCVKSVLSPEPWYIGMIFGLFLLGATSTKDFADIEGDRAGGCRTLPVRYGVRTAARMISPFFIFPFLLMPAGAAGGVLTGNPVALTVLGFVLSGWGAYVVYLILREPEALARTENHPSWTHMYLMMLATQIGFAASYLL
jgi:geranylgeranylglycerol-phosphate geranylgeranyltransferase